MSPSNKIKKRNYKNFKQDKLKNKHQKADPADFHPQIQKRYLQFRENSISSRQLKPAQNVLTLRNKELMFHKYRKKNHMDIKRNKKKSFPKKNKNLNSTIPINT